MDQVFQSNSVCSGTWRRDAYQLKQKNFPQEDVCMPYEGGVCFPTSKMHPMDLVELGVDPLDPNENDTVWCPVFEGWSDDKMKFCVSKWNALVGGLGGLVPDECEGEFCEENSVKYPIPYSSGPAMTAKSIVSHELTLRMMKQTRAFCDDDTSLHCWMSGALLGICGKFLYSCFLNMN